ncbi:MAG: hypothetical protein Q4F17_06365 [Eubacteriales bacterium]|nr:hypothetical protein [Eubacteriales bacterium]
MDNRRKPGLLRFGQTPEAAPAAFREMTGLGYLAAGDVLSTGDGFFAVTRSLADLLLGRGITALESSRGEALECRLFFDDWYLYALGPEDVWGLFKMREQEHDAELGLRADGDTPGVTVSFIAFRMEALLDCLANPTPASRANLERELNRVVASRGQRHSPAMKEYFARAEALGPYLIAELYVRKIASLAPGGVLPLPGAALRRVTGSPRGRIAAFLAANNRRAGYPVWDGRQIILRDPDRLTEFEQYAILATHTANLSYNSFAAEVCFHARFLTGLARLPIPLLGRSVYDSAIRADMTIDEGELVGPTPYYHPNSRLMRRQRRFHGEI